MSFEHRPQLASLRALAGDEAKFLQSLPEECSNVLPVICNADTRPDLSPAERNELARLFSSMGCHNAQPSIERMGISYHWKIPERRNRSLFRNNVRLALTHTIGINCERRSIETCGSIDSKAFQLRRTTNFALNRYRGIPNLIRNQSFGRA
jgi:hypothetical protein